MHPNQLLNAIAHCQNPNLEGDRPEVLEIRGDRPSTEILSIHPQKPVVMGKGSVASRQSIEMVIPN